MSDVRVFDWDDEIEYDGDERSFVTLEEGDYDFEVIKFERGHYTPSPEAKTPACNMAVITLKISTDEGRSWGFPGHRKPSLHSGWLQNRHPSSFRSWSIPAGHTEWNFPRRR